MLAIQLLDWLHKRGGGTALDPKVEKVMHSKSKMNQHMTCIQRKVLV